MAAAGTAQALSLQHAAAAAAASRISFLARLLILSHFVVYVAGFGHVYVLDSHWPFLFLLLLQLRIVN
jgi:hypothetical protein